jgi:hypothetical protein
MKTIVAASATGTRVLHQAKRKHTAHHHRPSHQRMGKPSRSKETKGEIIFTTVCLVILLAFIIFFTWYLFAYSPLV